MSKVSCRGGGYSEPWHFLHMLDNTKVSRMVKTHIFYFMPPPLFAHFKESVSLKKRAKRGGVIKDKMCILTKQETFVLSSICQKCQGTQIKAVLLSQSPSLFDPPLIRNIKTLLFGYADILGICLVKQKFLVWWKYTFYLLWS